MILSITTTHQPSTDLGYLLHKNPNNIHRRSFSFGELLIFFPTTREDECTAVLNVQMDSIDLVKRKGRQVTGVLSTYVNDRPNSVEWLHFLIRRVKKCLTPRFLSSLFM